MVKELFVVISTHQLFALADITGGEDDIVLRKFLVQGLASILPDYFTYIHQADLQGAKRQLALAKDLLAGGERETESDSTLAPFLRKSLAVASPIPLAPPVMRATLLDSILF